jgi:hypothetical protein
MLSLKACDKILNHKGKNYTEEQIKIIRDVLYQLAEIEFQQFKNQAYEKESSYLHKGVDR